MCGPQEVLTESGQLQFAREDILRARGFECRVSPLIPAGDSSSQESAGGGPPPHRRSEWSCGAGGRRYVVPVDEIVEAFWAYPTGKKMKVRGQKMKS